jgi:hypothetical protein
MNSINGDTAHRIIIITIELPILAYQLVEKSVKLL